MNINVPNLVDAALPKAGGKGSRNVGIIAANMNGPNYNDPGFLSDDFPKTPPRLYVTSEDDEFDVGVLNAWREEGFNVEYFAMGPGGRDYKAKLSGLKDTAGLGPCETFGIVAYGEAASVCLEHFHIMENNPDFKLSCLIAYYPTRIPDPRFKFPGGVQVLLHLAGEDVGLVKRSQMVGIQGKKRTSKKKLDRGVGTGRTVRMAFSAFSYDADPGFAEADMTEYDHSLADLSWSRSVAAARKAFRWETNVMGVVEENMECKFFAKDESRLMKTYTTTHEPHVNYMPTLVGGLGTDEIAKFYGDFFMESNPESMEVHLISRTADASRVVDELYVSFQHTMGMPWILPGIPPTGRHVEIIIVSIVMLRGGKIHHENIYWDQASVLVQVGLLKQEMVPKRLKAQGVERLPVVGGQAAQRIIDSGFDDGEGAADNELLPEMFDDEDDYSDEEQQDEEDYDDDVEESEEEVEEEQPPPPPAPRPRQNGQKGKGPAAPKQPPRQAPQQPPKQIPKQTPKQTPKQNTKQTPKQNSTQNSTQNPRQAQRQPQKQQATQAPKQAPKQQRPRPDRRGRSGWSQRNVNAHNPIPADQPRVQEIEDSDEGA